MKKTKKRTIAVVTGTRAEYGILKPLLEKIKKSDNLDLKLIVTGMHLLKDHGNTIAEIKADGFKVAGVVEMYDNAIDDSRHHSLALAKGVAGFTNLFFNLKPDMLVVFGDRLEPLAATLASIGLSLPVAHIHGGDKTDSGHIDESIRHALSRFSHLHFTATLGHVGRLIKMGEEPRRIFRVGALGLDSIVNQEITDKKRLFKKLNLATDKKTMVCVFHPLYTEIAAAGKQMEEILQAVKFFKLQTVVIYPNNDSGSSEIIKEIKKNENISFIKIFANLKHGDYVSLLARADVLIGNSSSGIIEALSLGLPAVNIGLRNVGREHGENVIFTKVRKNEIIKAIRKALYEKDFKKQVAKSKNPYGEGKTSARIVKILAKVKIDKSLLQKKITY